MFNMLLSSRGYKSRSRSPVGRKGRGSPVYSDFRPRASRSRSNSRSYNY